MIISVESEWIYDLDLPISIETHRCTTTLCFSFVGTLSSSLHEGLGPLCTVIVEWTQKDGDSHDIFMTF